jgi:hypothetical protein
MIVAYDSFDGENYPIYVMPGNDPTKFFPSNGDKTEEVYNLSKNFDDQAAVGRAMNTEWEQPPVSLKPEGTLEDWQAYAAKLEQALTTAGFRSTMVEAIRNDHFHG